MGETGTLEIYDKIWQEAKNAEQAAGYTEYVAFAGEKTLQIGSSLPSPTVKDTPIFLPPLAVDGLLP